VVSMEESEGRETGEVEAEHTAMRDADDSVDKVVTNQPSKIESSVGLASSMPAPSTGPSLPPSAPQESLNSLSPVPQAFALPPTATALSPTLEGISMDMDRALPVESSSSTLSEGVEKPVLFSSVEAAVPTSHTPANALPAPNTGRLESASKDLSPSLTLNHPPPNSATLPSPPLTTTALPSPPLTSASSD
jgi:hypothetical protein